MSDGPHQEATCPVVLPANLGATIIACPPSRRQPPASLERDAPGPDEGSPEDLARVRRIVLDPRVSGREIAALELAVMVPDSPEDLVMSFVERFVPAGEPIPRERALTMLGAT